MLNKVLFIMWFRWGWEQDSFHVLIFLGISQYCFVIAGGFWACQPLFVIIVTKYWSSGAVFNQQQQLRVIMFLKNIPERDAKRMKNDTGLPAYLCPGAHCLTIHPQTWQMNDVCRSTAGWRGRHAELELDNNSGRESSVKTGQSPHSHGRSHILEPFMLKYLSRLLFMPLKLFLFYNYFLRREKALSPP